MKEFVGVFHALDMDNADNDFRASHSLPLTATTRRTEADEH
jgi:hypothetical protein